MQRQQEKQQQMMQRQRQQEKQQQTMQRQEDVEKRMKRGRKRNLEQQERQQEDDVEKLMKLRKRNRESARRAKEKKENHIRSLESEARKNAYLFSALKTHIEFLESKIRSKNAIIQILNEQQEQEQQEQTGFSVKFPTGDDSDDYNLRRQFLFDVCQASDIPPELLDPLVREYNNGGGPVYVPMISDVLLKPWNYVDQLHRL